MNKITFHSNRVYNNPNSENLPEPTSKSIPSWYQSQDTFFKDPSTDKDFVDQAGNKFPTFKACPAVLDLFTTGYVLRTPCDIEFYMQDGLKKVKTALGYEEFCGERPPMPGFPTPHGYSDSHFHWWPNWAPGLPDGYSALYINPMNHFDLPFITVAGIIDNDKITSSGMMPFFLKEDFIGVIKAGTPFIQIIPFKREDWEMDLKFYTPKELHDKYTETYKTFRKPEGGVYKKLFWSRRKYK